VDLPDRFSPKGWSRMGEAKDWLGKMRVFVFGSCLYAATGSVRRQGIAAHV